MSRRNRRQQEELENLQAAAGLSVGPEDQQDHSTDEEEHDEYVPQASSSKFAVSCPVCHGIRIVMLIELVWSHQLLTGGQDEEAPEDDEDVALQDDAISGSKVGVGSRQL